ncbi:MAG TPA: 16S rRNA (guanine(527)-N(7))-methyltransferase RsmG [Candidatus Syntrophosphaera sp.]|nr:16S rRNA (guanine(527)-N(7))-methyltransferase RsmG [Candidatus Syntrophosphaera sp.]
MTAAKEEFREFLLGLGLPEPEKIMARFDLYHQLLWEKNSQLNLFSRATPEEELWTKHFLDSLVLLKCLELSGKKVLDFGSGAGLPGIPLKLAVPNCRMTLLDSVRKKCVALEEFVARLELNDCEVVCARLEDFAAGGKGFDYVLCRAVRLEDRYIQPLRRLLASQGKVIFYKARELEDIAPFEPQLLFQAEFSFGTRAIHMLDRAQLTH